MPRKPGPRSKSKRGTDRHWRFVLVRARVGNVGSVSRPGPVWPNWCVRFGVELHGAELRSLWRDTLLSVRYPLDTLVRVPTWVGKLEVGYQDSHGAWVIVPHQSPDTITRDDGVAVPVHELAPDTPAFTL